MANCAACQLKDRPDIPCVGLTSPVFCGWAARGGVHARSVVLRSEMAAAGAELPGKAEANPGADVSPPSLLRKAANFGKAIVDHVASGMETSSDATIRERTATCHACEMFEASNRTCKMCGCFLSVKIRMKISQCPISKW